MSHLNKEIRRAAMNLLARREHSIHELKRKLTSKFESQEGLDATLQALTQDGLQSDKRYAAAYLGMRSNSGMGPVRIRSELVQRGVEPAIIDRCFAQAEICWHQQLTKVRVKKFGESLPCDITQRAKQACFLQYRGFDSEMISELIYS